MLRAMYTAASGMEAQQLNIDTIAHNLANVNTSGFKQRKAQFQDLVYQNLRQAGPPARQRPKYLWDYRSGLEQSR